MVAQNKLTSISEWSCPLSAISKNSAGQLSPTSCRISAKDELPCCVLCQLYTWFKDIINLFNFMVDIVSKWLSNNIQGLARSRACVSRIQFIGRKYESVSRVKNEKKSVFGFNEQIVWLFIWNTIFTSTPKILCPRVHESVTGIRIQDTVLMPVNISLCPPYFVFRQLCVCCWAGLLHSPCSIATPPTPRDIEPYHPSPSLNNLLFFAKCLPSIVHPRTVPLYSSCSAFWLEITTDWNG